MSDGTPGEIAYSVVVPIYNDGALARDFCVEVEKVFRSYLGKEDISADLEIIFVDDGSANDSPQILKNVCDEFAFAKAMLLSRNFGQHIAVSAGYRAARGDCVIMLNVDQEDPPSQIPILIDELKAGGHDIVVGRYKKRGTRLINRVTSYLFYATMNRLTGYDSPMNMATMRVMTRRATDVYNRLSERARYLPGLEMWLGLKHGNADIEHQKRRAGTSSYNFRRRLRFAIASIISFSDFPLRMAVKFGMVVATLGALLASILVIDRLFLHTTLFLPGYISTLAIIVFLGGVQIMVTGIASLYIGRILAEVQQRPLFVVREIYGGAVRAISEPVLRGA